MISDRGRARLQSFLTKRNSQLQNIQDFRMEDTTKVSLHTNPIIYGVYLLQSVPRPQSFYIGSTPDPLRRLRQHNGDLKAGGAYRTKRAGARPWKMVALVANFPSKIAALQFEHAFQHAYQTRHIRPELRVTKSRLGGNSINHKLANIRLLVSSVFFSTMNLKVVIFEQDIEKKWTQNRLKIALDPKMEFCDFDEFTRVRRKGRESGIDETDNKEFEQAIDGTEIPTENYEDSNLPTQNTQTSDSFLVSSEIKLIEKYFESAKKVIFDGPSCRICDGTVDYLSDDIPRINSPQHLNEFLSKNTMPLLAVCYHCEAVFHMSCLAPKFLEESNKFIPTYGNCLNCLVELEWTTLSKVSTRLRKYALKDYLEV